VIAFVEVAATRAGPYQGEFKSKVALGTKILLDKIKIVCDTDLAFVALV
jgi:hypothetical protein